MTAPSWGELLERVKLLCYYRWRSWQKSRRRSRIAKLQAKRINWSTLSGHLNIEPGMPIRIGANLARTPHIDYVWDDSDRTVMAPRKAAPFPTTAYRAARERAKGQQVFLADGGYEAMVEQIIQSRAPIPGWPLIDESLGLNDTPVGLPGNTIDCSEKPSHTDRPSLPESQQ